MPSFFDKIKTSPREDLTERLRISVVVDSSHEEIHTYHTTKMKMIVYVTVAVLLLMGITYFLTAHTALRRTIPGYPSARTRDAAVENILKLDSLERAIDLWAFQVANIQRVITGETPIPIDSVTVDGRGGDAAVTFPEKYAGSDSILREEVLRQEQSAAAAAISKNTSNKSIFFFTPIKGLVTEGFNRATGHTSIEIAAETDAMVYAVDEGTIISASWSDMEGYSIFIQHRDNIISIYRHNEKLLKKEGDKVSAGTPIALAGSAGSLSSRPVLKFELWQSGEAIDPSLYINF